MRATLKQTSVYRPDIVRHREWMRKWHKQRKERTGQ